MRLHLLLSISEAYFKKFDFQKSRDKDSMSFSFLNTGETTIERVKDSTYFAYTSIYLQIFR